mmetsp:Transcript_11890/g.22692  ORF Transcript_11890/g.22692 Transcript_11890/m.22692 type:complete len:163 (+) Transcript_11890:94-582(+)
MYACMETTGKSLVAGHPSTGLRQAVRMVSNRARAAVDQKRMRVRSGHVRLGLQKVPLRSGGAERCRLQANCQYDGSMGSEGMTESDKKNLEIGAVVVVCEMPAFVKTSNAMTALRDAKSVISIGEPGRILDRKPKGNWVVRFKSGSYLIDEKYFKLADQIAE